MRVGEGGKRSVCTKAHRLRENMACSGIFKWPNMAGAPVVGKARSEEQVRPEEGLLPRGGVANSEQPFHR